MKLIVCGTNIQDVILPRMLDDATVANLNSIIHANNAVVRFAFAVVKIFYLVVIMVS